jgi:hypothetical protein
MNTYLRKKKWTPTSPAVSGPSGSRETSVPGYDTSLRT